MATETVKRCDATGSIKDVKTVVVTVTVDGQPQLTHQADLCPKAVNKLTAKIVAATKPPKTRQG
jgi:hypothetical protein